WCQQYQPRKPDDGDSGQSAQLLAFEVSPQRSGVLLLESIQRAQRFHRRGDRIVSFAENQVGGEQAFSLFEIFPAPAVDGDDGLELFVDLIKFRESITGLEERPNSRLQLTELLQEHGASLEPRLLRLILGQVRSLCRGNVIGSSNHLFNVARD